jgi:peroxiredoxin Q/BCP
MDDAETLKKFKAELKAPYSFIPDPEGKIVGLYDVKMPAMPLANRASFVVGADRKVVKVQSGKDAVDPSEAIASCPLKKKKEG